MKWWPQLDFPLMKKKNKNDSSILHAQHPWLFLFTRFIFSVFIITGHATFITDVNTEPCKHLWGCEEMYYTWDGAAVWCTVRYTHWVENDSHFGAGEPHFLNHYLLWFNGTRRDKRDGVNSEERKRIERHRGWRFPPLHSFKLERKLRQAAFNANVNSIPVFWAIS